jgi:hypothetical protein
MGKTRVFKIGSRARNYVPTSVVGNAPRFRLWSMVSKDEARRRIRRIKVQLKGFVPGRTVMATWVSDVPLIDFAL